MGERISSEELWKAFAGEDVTVWFDGPEDQRFIAAVDRMIAIISPVAVRQAEIGFKELLGNRPMILEGKSFAISSKTPLKIVCIPCGEDLTPPEDPDGHPITLHGLLDIEHVCTVPRPGS